MIPLHTAPNIRLQEFSRTLRFILISSKNTANQRHRFHPAKRAVEYTDIVRVCRGAWIYSVFNVCSTHGDVLVGLSFHRWRPLRARRAAVHRRNEKQSTSQPLSAETYNGAGFNTRCNPSVRQKTLHTNKVLSSGLLRLEIDGQFSLWFLLQWHQKTQWVFQCGSDAIEVKTTISFPKTIGKTDRLFPA